MQGIRRVVAVTGAEAEAAVADGEALAARLAHADTLKGAELEPAVAALKLVCGAPSHMFLAHAGSCLLLEVGVAALLCQVMWSGKHH